MGDRASSGFTIVETTLFLAVTGALIAGMIFATSATISVQRYRDATESFKALLQSQFSEVTNVQNSRDNDRTCTSEGAVIDGDALRGQSGCVLLGKYMIIRGGDVTVYPVLASEIVGADEPTDDIEALQDTVRLNLALDEVKKLKLEWDVRIDWVDELVGSPVSTTPDKPSSPSNPRSIGMLFIRSPISGQVYTFTSNTVQTETWIESSESLPQYLKAMVQPGTTVPGQRGRTICLESAGLTSIPNVAIYLAPNASAASAVEVRSNDVSAGMGAPERC